MELIRLPTAWAIALDFVAWATIHLGAASIASSLPASAFERDSFPYREWGWEQGGRVYSRFLGVRRWKHHLPDGAKIFPRGFPKARLQNSSRGYLEKFLVETRRAELTHWLAMTPVPIFLTWHDWRIVLIMLLYALGANLPCIVAQRYNRARLRRVLRQAKSRAA